MSIFSIFKAPETIDKALSAVINAGDALVYTDEEKAEMRLKIADIHLKHIQATAGENNHTSIARRWLSAIITVPFVLLTLGSAAFEAFGMPDIAEHWQTLAMDDYSMLVMMSSSFYFGSHLVQSLKK